MPTLHRLFVALSLMLVVTVASAAGVTPHNYFGNDYSAHLLDMVEKYHLPKARQQMKNEGTIQWALADVEFVLSWFPNHPQALEMATTIARKKGAPESADKYYVRALQMYPSSGMTRLLYALHLHRTRRVDQAIEEYHKAIEMEPDNANAYYNLGLALLSEDRVAEAKKAAEKAYALGYPLPGLRKMLAERTRKSD